MSSVLESGTQKESGVRSTSAPYACSALDRSVERWAAIRTSAHWEKKAAERLAAAGVAVFLPTLTRETRYKTRKNVSQLPLFPGYLFFDEGRLPELAQLGPRAKDYIAQVLRPPDYAVLRTELQHIAALLQDGHLVQSKVYGLPGETVRITRGSFKDLEGKILRQLPGSNRFVLAISFLGLSVEVEVADRAIQKVL